MRLCTEKYSTDGDTIIWFHLSVDDVVDAHQRVLLVATVGLQAILGRSCGIQAWGATCWCTTQEY